MNLADYDYLDMTTEGQRNVLLSCYFVVNNMFLVIHHKDFKVPKTLTRLNLNLY